jgi:hypothetical protein
VWSKRIEFWLDPAQGEGNARPHNTTLSERSFAMPDFESSIVTSTETLRALYAQPIERSAKKQLTTLTRLAARLLLARLF